MNAVAWVHFMEGWSCVKVYFGRVGVVGHFYGWLGMVRVGGSEWTIFMGR